MDAEPYDGRHYLAMDLKIMNWVNYLNNCITIINSAINFHAAIEQKYRFRDLKMHLCCIMMLCIFIGQSVHRGKTLVLNQPAVLFFILTVFHLPPLSYSSIPPPFLSYTTPFIFPSPLPRALPSRYQGVIPSPSKVKWYKVIGGSGLLTGWPPQGLLPAANRTLASPTAACLHPWWALGGTSRDR